MRLVLAALIVAFGLNAASAQSVLYKQPLYSQPTGGCLPSAPLPGDAMPSASVTAAYGTCALFKNWMSGNLFDVTAQSRTITIRAINGYPDVNTLASLMGISPTSGIGGLALSKWYDQSGNGNNCTQATAANQPWIWLINGKVFVAGDGMLLNAINATGGSDKYCNFPAGMTTNNVAQSAYAVIQLGTTGNAFGFAGNYNSTLYQTGTAIGAPGDGIDIASGDNGSGNTQWFVINFVDFDNQTMTQVTETQPLVAGVVSGGSAFNFTQNEESYSGAALTGTGTTTGGTLMAGEAAGTKAGFFGRMQAFLIAGATALNSSQQTTERNSLYARFGIAKTQKYSILVDGASVDAGEGAFVGTLSGNQIAGVMGYGWMQQLQDLVPYPIRWGNTGVPGATVENLTTNFAASQGSFFAGTYTKKILIGPGGALGNSIASGDTGAQAYTALTNYLTAAESAGWAAGNIFVSLIWQNPTGAAVTFNNLLLANAASLGVNVMGPATLNTGNPGPGCPMSAPLNTVTGTSNATYYNQSAPFTGHPTVVGYNVYAKCYWPQVIQQAIGGFLLQRDLDPGANDNAPAWLNKAA